MIKYVREAGLLWPLLFVIVAMPTLIALGNWQWSRMSWKQGLLRDLKQAASADAVPLADLLGTSVTTPGTNWEAKRFRRVIVKGTFEHLDEMHVWSPQQTGPAWSVVTPLRLQPDANGRLPSGATRILVVRGVVPAASKSAPRREAGQIGGVQTVVGRVRIDRPNAWANEPNIKTNEWFTRDLTVMTTHLRRTAKATGKIVPVFVEAEQQMGGTSAPIPDLKALTLSNRHLEYAMTWWALAATLAGVFVAFAWGRLKTAKI